MAFLSLYRKYRPRNFEDLVGQEHVVRTLKNALRNKRIAHAYLFAGPRGTGKTSTAKVFARALNCVHGPTAEPCGECDTCKKIQSGQSIDVIEIDAASNRGIDEIRVLREKVKFYPSEGSYKVYIIDEVHMLTKGAFNALLKTLEEPPENVVFILATTEPHKVIDTILSRCQRFDFSLLSLNDIRARLEYICQEEGITYEGEALQIIARSSKGGLRDAISLLDQAISYTNANLTVADIQQMLGKVDEEVLNQFFNHIINRNSAEALELVNQLINRGYGVSIFVSDLIEHARQLLLIKECGISSPIFDFAEETLYGLEQVSQSVDSSRLIRIIEILTGMERDLSYTDQPRLVIEIGVVKMASPEVDSTLEGLRTRVAELENRLKGMEGRKEDKVNRASKSEINDELEKKTDRKIRTEQVEKDKRGTKISEQVSELAATKDDTFTITLDQVRKAWPAILKEVKENNISVQAYLLEGQPLKVDDDTIYIHFPEDKGFHKKGAEREEALIKKAISRVLGQPCRLKFEIAGPNKKEVVKKKEEIKAEDNLVDRVVKLFDGELIKVNYNVLKD